MPPYQQAITDILSRQRGSAIFWVLFYGLAPLFQPDFLASVPFYAAAILALSACAAIEIIAWRYWDQPDRIPRWIGTSFLWIAAVRNTSLGFTLGHHYWRHGITEVDLLGTAMLMAFALGAILVVRPNWTALVIALSGLAVPPVIGALLVGSKLGVAVATCLTGSFIFFVRQARADHLHYWRALHDARSLRIAQQRAAENARREAVLLASQSRQNAIAAERSRIAAEWHDSLLASLSAASLQIEATQRRIPRSKEDNEGLRLVLDTIRHCRAEARLAISDLLAASGHEEDLTVKLPESLEPMVARAQARFHFQVQGDAARSHSPLEAREILRICQEAVSNSLRHGKASSVDLTLAYSEDHCSVVLTDDGCGFDPAQIPPGHFGLIIIRQRAERLAAQLDVSSQPGQGTRLTLVVPRQPHSVKPVRILVIEGSQSALTPIPQRLAAQPGVEIVGVAEDPVRALDLFRQTQPDLAVLAPHTPDGSGVPLLRQIRERDNSAKVLVVTAAGDTETIAASLADGALGYINPNCSSAELFEAIETVSTGRQFLPAATSNLSLDGPPPDDLTPRELDVIELAMRGHTHNEIGGMLGIPERSVNAHMAGALMKLHASNLEEAANIASRRGLVEAAIPAPPCFPD